MHRKIAYLSLIVMIPVLLMMVKPHLIVSYKINSNKMMPIFHKNETVWASSLIKPTYNRIICFTSKVQDPSSKTENVIISRILGLGGDTIELNDGYILRNGLIADNPYQLMFIYYAKKYFIYDLKLLDKLSIPSLIIKDTVLINLTSMEYKKLSYNVLLRKINNPSLLNHYLNNKCNKITVRNENDIQIIVPEGCCFVIGDNRGEEYFPLKSGIVKLADIKASVFY